MPIQNMSTIGIFEETAFILFVETVNTYFIRTNPIYVRESEALFFR